MLFDWAFAQRGSGVIVIETGGIVTVLEFNAFLKRIACGAISGDDSVVSAVFTDGQRRRVGDLRVFEMVRGKQVRTDDLACRVPEGVLASGRTAHLLLEAVETNSPMPDGNALTLLRPISGALEEERGGELLRALLVTASSALPDELVRPSSVPDAET